MTPHVVVDVGNTRIKWGLVGADGRSVTRTASLPEDEAAWGDEIASCSLTRSSTWVVASVRPQRSERLVAWLRSRGDEVVRVEKAAQLPLVVALEMPDYAGIDRLLNAVAARRHLELGRGAVLIGAGTAVTLDWLDEAHAFRGGAIFPGLDLMADALHRHAALLPPVQVTLPVPALPAGNTIAAMQAGLVLAVTGGIREAVRLYAERAATPPRVFFTGGQAPLLARTMGLLDERPRPQPWADFLLWPEQTLVGILDSVGGRS
jgi:type III pantothenate kinase